MVPSPYMCSHISYASIFVAAFALMLYFVFFKLVFVLQAMTSLVPWLNAKRLPLVSALPFIAQKIDISMLSINVWHKICIQVC